MSIMCVYVSCVVSAPVPAMQTKWTTTSTSKPQILEYVLRYVSSMYMHVIRVLFATALCVESATAMRSVCHGPMRSVYHGTCPIGFRGTAYCRGMWSVISSNFESQSTIEFSNILWPRSVEKRPKRLRSGTQVKIQWHFKYYRRDVSRYVSSMYMYVIRVVSATAPAM